MPNATPISINKESGDVSPLVFNPIQVNPSLCVLKARVGVIPAGDRTLRLLYSNPTAKNKRKTYKAGLHYDYPLERTVDSITTASDIARFGSDDLFTIPDTMTDVERAEFAYAAGEMVTNAIIAGYVTDLEPLW